MAKKKKSKKQKKDATPFLVFPGKSLEQAAKDGSMRKALLRMMKGHEARNDKR